MRRAQSGFGIIEVLIILGVIGIAGYSLMTMFAQSQARNNQARVVQTIKRLRINMVTTLESKFGWSYTSSNPKNQSLKRCVYSPYDCPPGKHELTNVSDNSGIEFYNGADPSQGFDIDGKNCAQFQDGVGNNGCPLRWKITWRSACFPGFTCDGAPLIIEGRIDYQPSTATGGLPVLNPENYSFQVIRSPRYEARYFSVSHSMMSQYHPSCQNCLPQQKVFCDSACHRYCLGKPAIGAIAAAVAADPKHPLGEMNFFGGSMVECSTQFNPSTTCLCNK